MVRLKLLVPLKVLDKFSVFLSGRYHTALNPSAQNGVPDDTLRPRLHPARAGRPDLGRRHVFRLDGLATSGRRSPGRPGPPEAVGTGFPEVFCLGMGRGHRAADHGCRHDPVTLHRLRNRPALCAGDDGAVPGDGCAVHPHPVPATARATACGRGRTMGRRHGRAFDPVKHSRARWIATPVAPTGFTNLLWERLLKPLHVHQPRWPRNTWLPWQARMAGLATVGTVNNATLGLAALACKTAGTWQTTRTALYLHIDALGRVITRQLQAHLRTRSAVMAVATVVPVETTTRSTPGATRVLAIAAVQPDITRRTGAPACIDRKLFSGDLV